MLNLKRLRLLRVAQRVIRCHSTPTLHRQSVGEHTFGVLNIIYSTVYDPSPGLVRAALWHDAAEAVTGDIPGMHKAAFGASLVALEATVEDGYAISVGLLPEDKMILKYADLMELAMFALEEADMGHKSALVLAENALIMICDRRLWEFSSAAEELYEVMRKRLQEQRQDLERARNTFSQWFDYFKREDR